jgi:glycosyltransferase involved in cell wall biosynthesis
MPLAGLPVSPLPGKRRWLEAAWLLLDVPKADRWCRAADWVYCPAEAYVPTVSARLAVTMHCVNWFEPELPWYNDPEIRWARRRMGIRWRKVLDRAQLVPTVSAFLKQRISALFGTDPAKIVVVGNGVEEEFFAAGRSPPGEPSGKPYLLIVGGLTQRKGADYVLPLAAELARRQPAVEIRVAGQSEARYREAIKQQANIIELGYQGLDALPTLLRRSVALLFLSRYDTFGIPSIEAMAAGTPVIAAHFAALPEVLGDAGIVLDPTQSVAIADIVHRLVREPSYRDDLIQKGLKRAEDFHWSQCVARLHQALQMSG